MAIQLDLFWCESFVRLSGDSDSYTKKRYSEPPSPNFLIGQALRRCFIYGKYQEWRI